jgi:hypothetical protein
MSVEWNDADPKERAWAKREMAAQRLEREMIMRNSLPRCVSVVHIDGGGVQIEGHTLQQDWEIELDVDGNVLSAHFDKVRT